ncbi:unnamed protein product [Calypogeia fissa]
MVMLVLWSIAKVVSRLLGALRSSADRMAWKLQCRLAEEGRGVPSELKEQESMLGEQDQWYDPMEESLKKVKSEMTFHQRKQLVREEFPAQVPIVPVKKLEGKGAPFEQVPC